MSDWYKFPEFDPGDFIVPEYAEQVARPHIFALKHRRRRGAADSMPTHGASDAGIAEFEKVYSAADFAQASSLSLDILTTIKFDRLGLFEANDIQAELTRFLKNYHAWCDARGLPAAWIYAIEASEDGAAHHAHIALYVTGNLAGWPRIPDERNPRRLFREWISGYTERHFGVHIPRAILARGGLTESPVNHWRVITYLLKGHDRFAMVQSARSTPDGRPVYLKDLMPWPYSNPGRVAISPRIKVSHSLGPKQRAIGAPTGMTVNLPRKIDWGRFNLFRTTPMSIEEELDTAWMEIVPQPFRSKFEDGVRDVRELYPAKFYRIIARQEPYPPVVPVPEQICLTCQLREIADAME